MIAFYIYNINRSIDIYYYYIYYYYIIIVFIILYNVFI